jgi:hypothetical protein
MRFLRCEVSFQNHNLEREMNFSKTYPQERFPIAFLKTLAQTLAR